MDDSPLRDFFLNPVSARQREYEALRSVFVDGLCQKAAAERFGLSYPAFRQLVHSFRQAVTTGSPPSSTDPVAADPLGAGPAAPSRPNPG